MAIPGRVEEALIQHRYGYSMDLPDYLEEAEIAFTVDDGGVFIGAPMFKKIDGRERASSNIYPYHNIRILTEVSENSEIITVPYNPFNEALNMPIILEGYQEPDITNTDIITINGVQLRIIPTDNTINAYVNRFNNAFISAGINNISFDAYNNKFRIIFYAKENETLIMDSVTDQALQHFGLVSPLEVNVTHKVITPTSRSTRTLSEILSDRISIKTFGVMNNNSEDSSLLTNATISMLYRADSIFLRKDLFFPAGQYNFSSDSVYLANNVKMVGEYNTFLTFNNVNSTTMFTNTDTLGYYPSVQAFGNNKEEISNIEIDNFNISTTKQLNGFTLYGVNNFKLLNSSIKSNNAEVLISNNIVQNVFDSMHDFTIENVVIDGAKIGIELEATSKIVLKKCIFKNISDFCINLSNCSNVIIEECDFSDSSITGKFLQLVNCKNVIIKNCIFPEDFNLLNANNNKILSTTSSFELEDYITVEIASGVATNILSLYQRQQDDIVVKLTYDIYGRAFQDRSGVMIKKLLSNTIDTSINNINDSNMDDNLPFQMNKQGTTVTFSLNNLRSSTAYIRYKLSIISLPRQ